MERVILIKNGELALKGLNRSTFEDILIKNIRRSLPDIELKAVKAQSTITVEPPADCDFDTVADRVGKVFGIAAYSVAAVCEKDLDKIDAVTEEFLGEKLSEAKTFKVEAKRADKTFPLNSREICVELGGRILSRHPRLKVDVHAPELTVNIEIRDTRAFIHAGQTRGAGGLPTGTAGTATVLISGGIDSPVASYMMAKRGLSLEAVHFASPPYTSQRAEDKVVSLLSVVAKSCGVIPLFIVNFTELQEAIRDNIPEEYFTLVMRRMMMRIASIIAERQKTGALITGESLGQVASQTMPAIRCTDMCATLPVLRPCIGLDKTEIIATARKIGTFDISIEPYEDCCTVFTPKHPKTRPDPAALEKAEQKFDWRPMVESAAAGARKILIK